MNKRILIISTGNFSGIKSSLVRALEQQGCEVLTPKLSIRNLRLWPVYLLLQYAHAFVIYRTSFRRYLHRTYTAFWVMSKAANVLVERNRDVDLVLVLNSSYIDLNKYKNKNIKYAIFTDHTNMLSKRLPDYGFDIPEAKVYPGWNQIERDMYSLQDNIFVMGNHVKDSLVNDYGIDHKKVTVVGGGPNMDIDIEADHIKKDFTQQNILFVGFDAERKGLPILEKAFTQLRHVIPKAKLHVVGVENNNKHNENITYHGKVYGETLKDLFYSSQIFVLPTYREPFGIVFLEAAWANTVCIGTNLGAIPEIVKDGESGYLINPGDWEALAEKLVYLFQNPLEMEKMANSGYLLAKSKWSWDHTASKIISNVFVI